ncbi:MAG TPA: cytochrome c oxidase assembly protein [Gammaproteobacteria bacterium]|nr:cytochrome c oxidase assembly protein [Gammaproteobacteria bacterium]
MGRAVDRTLVWKLAAICAAMFAFGFALVPLYNAFCTLTGFGGKTAGVAAAATLSARPDPTRTLRVELVASLPRGAPWEFAPDVTHLDVHPGELYVTHFRAENLTGRELVAQAVPSVAPGEAARHFRKTECFCFTTQRFAPHESRELKVAFMVEPALPEYIDTLTLSYTFFTAPQ